MEAQKQAMHRAETLDSTMRGEGLRGHDSNVDQSLFEDRHQAVAGSMQSPGSTWESQH